MLHIVEKKIEVQLGATCDDLFRSNLLFKCSFLLIPVNYDSDSRIENIDGSSQCKQHRIQSKEDSLCRVGGERTFKKEVVLVFGL